MSSINCDYYTHREDLTFSPDLPGWHGNCLEWGNMLFSGSEMQAYFHSQCESLGTPERMLFPRFLASTRWVRVPVIPGHLQHPRSHNWRIHSSQRSNSVCGTVAAPGMPVFIQHQRSDANAVPGSSTTGSHSTVIFQPQTLMLLYLLLITCCWGNCMKRQFCLAVKTNRSQASAAGRTHLQQKDIFLINIWTESPN